MIRRLETARLGLGGVLEALDRPPASIPAEVHHRVDEILAAVRARGDAALTELTERFDGFVTDPAGLRIADVELTAAERQLPERTRAALQYAVARVERYHKECATRSWRFTDEHGSMLGLEVRPLARVGLYVPGGRAAYPSTVVMTAVPARVAGVREVVLVTPPAKDGRVDPTVLAAARMSGVTEAYRLGGAQAIAALAYGTATVRRVDKIVGPGNIYVALAKAKVFGDVGIDMLAGPSEVVIVADGSADPACVAADLLAQAEHDPMARAILLTDAPSLADAVMREVPRRLERLARHAIARESLADHGAVVVTTDLPQAVELVNRLAPEHLGLHVADPDRWLPDVRSAGAVFLGRHSSEVVGDYVAGPSHVLPTGGTARFSSPLGTQDFVRRMSIVEYSAAGLAAAAPHIRALTSIEGLGAHGAAVDARLADEGGRS